MTNLKLNLVDSELVVKASGNFDYHEDLQLPQGKSIAELIYDQEKNPENSEDKEQK